jgi:uncharacterized protein YuzE
MTTDACTLLVTHEPRHGLSYVYLVGRTPRGQAKRSVSVGDDIVLDFDAGGALIGIELLRANLLHPSLAAVAVPPGGGHEAHQGGIAGLQADLALLALAWKGITPDRNTQTEAEAEATEAAIDAAAARALNPGAASVEEHVQPDPGLYEKALEDVRRDIFYFMTRHDPNRAKEAYTLLGTIKERITSVLGG